jgi:ketol-acid reductoisomerase
MFRQKDGVDKDGNPTDEATVLAEQRWENVLNEITYGLKCAKKIQDYDYEDKELAKKLKKSSQRSFELIGKHLFNLWD